jgi:hypothetical protein
MPTATPEIDPQIPKVSVISPTHQCHWRWRFCESQFDGMVHSVGWPEDDHTAKIYTYSDRVGGTSSTNMCVCVCVCSRFVSQQLTNHTRKDTKSRQYLYRCTDKDEYVDLAWRVVSVWTNRVYWWLFSPLSSEMKAWISRNCVCLFFLPNCRLLWIDKVRVKDKRYIWVSVWRKTTN